MFKKTILAITLIMVAVLVFVPAATFAATNIISGLNPITQGTDLTDATDINAVIATIIQWALGFVGAVAVAFIVYGGFRYTTSAGNPDARNKARDIILYAVIGLIIIIIAFVIVSTVLGLIS